MKNVTLGALLLTAAFAVSTTASADTRDDFDGGKRAAFEAIEARNKAASAASLRAAPSSALTAAPSAASGSNWTYAPCVNGLADGQYPCDRVDMLAHVDMEALGVNFVNDIWGWTDRWTRKDYVLLGAIEGTFVIDVSRPLRPKILGLLPTASDDPENPFWRDIKVYKNHAFIVSEQIGSGLQVLDLRQVRNLDTSGGPVTFESAAQYDEFDSAHNLHINERSGFAYVVGANTCLGGLEMIDIRDPQNPKNAGCFSEHGYVHDTQCVRYRGPDRDYRNREICFNSAANSAAPFFNTLSIVDVTDKENVQIIANKEYGNGFGYSHQGWLTPGQRYFLHDDELDEFFGSVTNTTTRLWDLKDLDNPVLIDEVTNGQTSVDHNLYIEGDYSYASNYTSGLRIFDIRKVGDGKYEEVAFFDMYPEDDLPTFDGGTWSNYPYFRLRNLVAVSSMDRGLFLLSPRLRRFKGDDDDDD